MASFISVILLTISFTQAAAFPGHKYVCRPLPGDTTWPSDGEWHELNATVGGRLIRGTPFASPCFGTNRDQGSCKSVLNHWTELEPRIADPVNVNSPFWNNNSCNPFFGNRTCTLGNLASYAINVSHPHHVVAGLRFAREKNIRLTIKNTGHDFLGRSTGAGALALWTHNMKETHFLRHHGAHYTGPAVRVGAGVQVAELLQAAQSQGLRVVGGDCPTVGVAGGWAQGGGHGHLGPKYGLGADNVLELDVVTPHGQRKTASPTENADLYWALGGGGAGTYAVVLSATFKAHPDGPVAGAKLSFRNTDSNVFWSAVGAWLRHVLVLDAIPGLSAVANMNREYFSLDFVTFPDATVDDLAAVLSPFRDELKRLKVTVDSEEIMSHATYYEHYNHFTTFSYDINNTLASRLISRSTVHEHLPELLSVLRNITSESDVGLALIGGNYTHRRVGNREASNAVHPAWRDSLICLNLFLPMAKDASWAVIQHHQKLVNRWYNQIKQLAPESGAYMNEATFDNPDWKQDYFGENYNKLLAIKNKYDPGHILWQNAGVGSDEAWALHPNGRLCPKQRSVRSPM